MGWGMNRGNRASELKGDGQTVRLLKWKFHGSAVTDSNTIQNMTMEMGGGGETEEKTIRGKEVIGREATVFYLHMNESAITPTALYNKPSQNSMTCTTTEQLASCSQGCKTVD